jgi:oligopeptide transport system permease protein
MKYVILALGFLALVGPEISPFSYSELHLEKKNLAPCWEYWFGSDDLGRDLFCRLWWGVRISLFLSLCAAWIEGLVGLLWGSIAAYAGGWVDEILMRICDLLGSIPSLLIAILCTSLLGSGFSSVLLSLVLVRWINLARIMRAKILQIKQMDYITSAKMMGASSVRIIAKHMLPNATSAIIPSLALSISTSIVQEAFLSVLGLGITAPYTSLGGLIYEGINAMPFYPWRFLIPSFIMVLLCSFRLET